MSQTVSSDQTTQEDIPRCGNKCRIPQRLPPFRVSRPQGRTKANAETVKGKFETVQSARFVSKNAARPRSTESRPKSANRTKDDPMSGRPAHTPTRPSRQERPERIMCQPKRPSTIPKRVMSAETDNQSKGKSVITVPLQNKPAKYRTGQAAGLPNQDIIQMREEMEMKNDISEGHILNEGESLSSRSEKITQLRESWKDELVQFKKMKSDLHVRQVALKELYTALASKHKKMSALGQKIKLPSLEDLCLMNVTNVTADQLLHMCTESTQLQGNDGVIPENCNDTIDLNKLYNVPTKLIATCEQTLVKRKEIIDWFDKLKQEEKCISTNVLTKKIKEFNIENEMLNCTLQKVKQEFLAELTDIVDYVRKAINDKVALQLHTEQLTYEVSDLNSQNDDLRKQFHTAEHSRSQNNRYRVQELEKELKEEKCKKMVISNRLSRAEGQVKIGVERASQLEAALERAHSQTWTLERTVQQLNEQNQKLQSDFDKELNKLTASIRENTENLEGIAEAREKLQTEKEDLEKKLQELSENYNESIKNIRYELNVNVARHAETEVKYNHEVEERIKVEAKLESICAQLVESEIRHKEMLSELQEKKAKLNKCMNYEKDLEVTKRELDKANTEIENYRNQLMKQSETIREIEINFNETIILEDNLKSDIRNKDEYIKVMEKKQTLLEEQLQESETKMVSYEKQLASLKNQIAQLKEDFGEFQNLNELHEMVIQQRAKLLEATRQNGELAEALQKKDVELESHIEHLAEQENVLDQREGVIKILSQKEDEQANIIKLLRNNLEMRAQADNDISQQLSEKNAEINALIANVDTRKQQISQLEKIILTLEEQLRKVNVQKRKDHEQICLMERTIAEYESYHLENKRSTETPTENLDNLIKMLENELGTPLGPQLKSRKIKDEEYNMMAKKKYTEERKRDNPPEASDNPDTYYQMEHDKMPTKIVMGNFVKKTYLTNEEQYKGDSLDRKRAITNIDTQKWTPAPDPAINVYAASPELKENMQSYRGIVPVAHVKDPFLTRNLQSIMSRQLRDEKMCKMFKFAGHRI